MSRSLFFVILPIVVVVFLFFPIFLETDLHYDMNRRKFGFVIFVFRIFKIIGGYAGTYQGGIALHISPKKAILIPYAQMNKERKRFSFMKTFRLRSLRLTTETGVEYMIPVSVAQTFIRGYFFAKGGRSKHIENNFWLTDGDVLRISLHCVLYFNLWILACSFYKFIKEKIKILWQKKMKKSTV